MMKRCLVLALALGVLRPAAAAAQHLLVPMDNAQQNHLKAYGLTYWVLKQGMTAEWLLNYRCPTVPRYSARLLCAE